MREHKLSPRVRLLAFALLVVVAGCATLRSWLNEPSTTPASAVLNSTNLNAACDATYASSDIEDWLKQKSACGALTAATDMCNGGATNLITMASALQGFLTLLGEPLDGLLTAVVNDAGPLADTEVQAWCTQGGYAYSMRGTHEQLR
jgi:hypothetical protein